MIESLEFIDKKDSSEELIYHSVKIPVTLFRNGPIGVLPDCQGESVEGERGIIYNDSAVEAVYPFINVVDLDWDGAQADDVTILNTTTDLINWIKRVSTLSTGLQKIDDDLSNYGDSLPEGSGIILLYQNNHWTYQNLNEYLSKLSNVLVYVTYNELRHLVEKKNLIPGMQYCITDYEATVNDEYREKDVSTTGEHLYIILVADSYDTLNENARVAYYSPTEENGEDDITSYFANQKLNSWKVKYCIDNDRSRFAWAEDGIEVEEVEEEPTSSPFPAPSQGDPDSLTDTDKGIYQFISYGDSEGNIEWATGLAEATAETATTNIETVITSTLNLRKIKVLSNSVEGFEEKYFYIIADAEPGNQIYRLYAESEDEPGKIVPIDIWVKIVEPPPVEIITKYKGKGVIYWMQDEFGNEAPYDFKNILFNSLFTFNNYTEDASLKSNCYNNKIEPCYITNEDKKVQDLNFITIEGYNTHNVWIKNDNRNIHLESGYGTYQNLVIAEGTNISNNPITQEHILTNINLNSNNIIFTGRQTNAELIRTFNIFDPITFTDYGDTINEYTQNINNIIGVLNDRIQTLEDSLHNCLNDCLMALISVTFNDGNNPEIAISTLPSDYPYEEDISNINSLDFTGHNLVDGILVLYEVDDDGNLIGDPIGVSSGDNNNQQIIPNEPLDPDTKYCIIYNGETLCYFYQDMVTSLFLLKHNIDLKTGDIERLTAVISPDYASKEVRWEVGNSNLITLSPVSNLVKDVIAGNIVGETTITCTSTKYPNLWDTCTVTVSEKTMHTITWDSNGGTPSIQTSEVEDNKPISTPETNPTRIYQVKWYSDGTILQSSYVEYTFNGWLYNDTLWSSEDIAKEDRAYTAVWTSPTGKLEVPADPTKNGYRFAGWSIKSNPTVADVINVSNMNKSDITKATNFYAVWVQQVTMTLRANGGIIDQGTAINTSGDVALTVDSGSTITLPGVTKNGQAGWWETSSGQVYQAGDSITITSNLTLYAKFNEVELTYYWYAGQTQPTSISGTPTVDDTNFTNNKWHTLSVNQLSQTITGGTAGTTWKVAVPSTKGFKFYDNTLTELDTTWDKQSSGITVNGVNYDIWISRGTGAKTNIYMK